jgi:hypothetical protein
MWIFAGNIQVVRVDELAVDLDKVVCVDGRLVGGVVFHHRRCQRRVCDRVVERLTAKIENVGVEELAVLRCEQLDRASQIVGCDVDAPVEWRRRGRGRGRNKGRRGGRCRGRRRGRMRGRRRRGRREWRCEWRREWRRREGWGCRRGSNGGRLRRRRPRRTLGRTRGVVFEALDGSHGSVEVAPQRDHADVAVSEVELHVGSHEIRESILVKGGSSGDGDFAVAGAGDEPNRVADGGREPVGERCEQLVVR